MLKVKQSSKKLSTSKTPTFHRPKKATLETGKFDLKDNIFIINDFKFTIRTRKEPTPKKPELFLSAVHVNNNTDYNYISSLFHVINKTYSFDYQGKDYCLKINADYIEIFRNNFKQKIEQQLNDILLKLNETILMGTEKDKQEMIFYRETLTAMLKHTDVLE